MRAFRTVLLLVSIFLISCGSYEPYVKYKYNYAPDYTWGYAEFYGDYYKNFNNANNVVSLSLFSDSLFINSKNELDGTGQYLFIEDLFIAPNDTVLPDGKYTVSDSGDAFTFYAGEKLDVDDVKYTIGAYIYYIEKNSAFSTVKLIDRGSFTINNIGGKQKIECDLVLSDSTVLKGSFNAALPHIDGMYVESTDRAPRKKLALKYPVKL